MGGCIGDGKITFATWVPAPILPAPEQLGELLLELNRPQEALEAFETSMSVTPDQGVTSFKSFVHITAPYLY